MLGMMGFDHFVTNRIPENVKTELQDKHQLQFLWEGFPETTNHTSGTVMRDGVTRAECLNTTRIVCGGCDGGAGIVVVVMTPAQTMSVLVIQGLAECTRRSWTGNSKTVLHFCIVPITILHQVRLLPAQQPPQPVLLGRLRVLGPPGWRAGHDAQRYSA